MMTEWWPSGERKRAGESKIWNGQGASYPLTNLGVLNHNFIFCLYIYEFTKPPCILIRYENILNFYFQAEDMSKKWHFEKGQDVKNNPLLKELSKQMGAKSSS